ncbi:MAG TPA: transposase [Chlamydiales bacterium]|nr:transposase [Chlamydiales bacterium]
MKRTIAIKLKPTLEESQDFYELQEVFSAACTQAANCGRDNKEKNRIGLHHLCYYALRKEFPTLGAQMACNAIAKASQALKAQRRPTDILFNKGCSIHYDKRTYSLKGTTLSLFTLKKRIQLTLEISPYHQKFLDQGKIKEAELVRKGKSWFFHLVLDLPDVPIVGQGKAVGVDFRENVVMASSTGKLIKGGTIKTFRDKFLAYRKRLQSNGSQSAKQQLRYISGREKRRMKYVNHCLSKEMIHEAKVNGCTAIAIEDLTNIRERIKAGKKARSRLNRWPFHQLRSFLEYKAAAVGIEIITVSPAYTSQTCSCCLQIGNRQKHRFTCFNCGSLQHSDLNASRNILRLALSADGATGNVNCRYVAA